MEVKIKLKIKDVEIELSVDEAKELEKILRAISGEEKPIWNPIIPCYPRYKEYEYPWTVTWGYPDTAGAADYTITYKY